MEKLSLLVKTVSLRRSRDVEMKHIRFNREIVVDLSQCERTYYERILARAGRRAANTERAISTHTLLSCILQMRQICSHGLQKQIAGRQSASQMPVSSDAFCSKCLEPLPLTSTLRTGATKIGEPLFCLECASEESKNQSLANDLSNVGKRNCLDSDISMVDADIGFAKLPVKMDLDATDDDNEMVSSKIQSVISNLTQLQKERNKDFTPVKRLCGGSIPIFNDVLKFIQSCLLILDYHPRRSGSRFVNSEYGMHTY